MAETKTQQQTTIPKLRFFEPIRNLPRRRTARTGESDFTIAFARAYLTQFHNLHGRSNKDRIACAREIPVNGLGIADLVCVLWGEAGRPAGNVFESPEVFHRSLNPTIRAFEVKLRDWRRAMMQANRCRCYAHSAVAVLPLAACQPALAYLETFRRIRVGLWGFDPERERIVQFHTPLRVSPRARRHVRTVLERVHRASRALPVQ